MSATRLRLPKCRDCGRELTMTEEHFYETRCEGCEGVWHARLQAWKEGKPDAEFDGIFSANPDA